MVLSDSSLAQRKEDKLDRFSVEASKWMIQMGGSISYGRVYIISRGFSVTNPNRGQSDRYAHACSPGRQQAQKPQGATAVQTNTTLATNAMSIYRVYTVHVVRAMHAQKKGIRGSGYIYVVWSRVDIFGQSLLALGAELPVR
jgi:hypothetical protein